VNNNKFKRILKFNGLDQEATLSKVSEINVSDKEFIYLDKLKDGSWRLCYTANTIPDIRCLDSIEIIRE